MSPAFHSVRWIFLRDDARRYLRFARIFFFLPLTLLIVSTIKYRTISFLALNFPSMVSQGKRGKRFFLRLLLSSFRSNCLNRPFTARTTPPSKYTFRRIYTQTWPCSAPLDAARFRFSPHRLVPKTLDVDGPLVVVLAPAVLPLY